MIHVTLDTNSLVDLEQNNEWAPFLKQLVQMHEKRRICLSVVAMSASERNPNGKYASSLEEFKKRIGCIGLSKVDILKPICYWGISFWDYCVWSDETTTKLERDIHRILFPRIEFDYSDYCKRLGLNIDENEVQKKWLNAKCDVLILWSHIWYKGDIFVTRDKNFFKRTKKIRLEKLGAKEITYPHEAFSLCAR